MDTMSWLRRTKLDLHVQVQLLAIRLLAAGLDDLLQELRACGRWQALFFFRARQIMTDGAARTRMHVFPLNGA